MISRFLRNFSLGMTINKVFTVGYGGVRRRTSGALRRRLTFWTSFDQSKGSESEQRLRIKVSRSEAGLGCFFSVRLSHSPIRKMAIDHNKLLILFGSQTGQAQAIAENVASLAQQRGNDTELLSMDEAVAKVKS